MMALRKRWRRERGFALAVTVLLAAFLALTAATVAISARTESLELRSSADLLLARELAVAGINIAIQDLARATRSNDIPHDGRPVVFALGTGTTAVTIEDEHGKLDLAQAPTERIREVFQAIGGRYGVDGFEAAILAQHASGLFSAAPTPSEGGQSMPSDDQAGNDATGERRRLLSLAQLANLPGMTPEFHAGLQRHVTVLGFSNKINPLTASLEVLSLVPGLDAANRDAILEARTNGTKRPTAGKAELWFGDDEGPAFTITGTGRLANGIEARVTAIVTSSGISLASTRVGVRILEFR
jgi:general secretion pathway protein K